MLPRPFCQLPKLIELKTIEKEAIPDSQDGVVTVSIGICYIDTTIDNSLYNCIKIADKALYQAKETGKNRAILLNTSLENL